MEEMQPDGMIAAACRLTGITVTSDSAPILEEVSVDFPRDACTVVMGPSGSGKSTLLKVAAGLVVPDGGTVEILGVDPARATDRELEALRLRNGFVFQDGALWQNMSLYDNIALPLLYHGVEDDPAAVRLRVLTLARELGATARLDLRPSQVSSGERKIISFIRAIAADPELLFMDEPTTSIDAERNALLIARLRSIRKRGATIIAVTHDARIASRIADFILVMKEGRVLRFGSLHEISRSGDPEVERILTDVLSETATYDGDILDLLDPDQDPIV